jgi:hypothetical protein
MPTQEQAKKAWEHGNKGKAYYDAMTEEQKKAMWQYGYDRKLINTSTLGPGAKAEYQKYVNPNKPEYAMQASIVEKNPKQYIQTQNEKVMAAITPSIVKNMAKQTPEQIATPKSEIPRVLTAAEKRRLLNEENIEALTPQEKLVTTGKAGLTKIPTNNNKMIPVGKAGLVKTQARDFNGIDAALLGTLDSATLGAMNIRDDAAIKENSGAFKAGQIGGYLIPYGTAAKAVKPVVGKIANTVLRNVTEGAIAGGGVQALENTIQGKSLEQNAKETGAGMLIGAGVDALLPGAGKLAKRVIDNIQLGKLSKIPVSEVATTVENGLKPTTLKGAYRVKNTALDKALNEYNEAIETIQNHFKTNELRTDEMARIKPELGIDLNAILKNIRNAEKGISVSEIGQRRNLSNVAGVTDLPKINKTVLKPPIANQKLSEGINSLPIENKSLTGAIKPLRETDKIKQAHSNIRNLKQQLDVASNPDEIKALKKTLAAERKTVKEFNNANRQTLTDRIRGLIKNSDNWKDKKGYTGTLRLQRETWDRNIIDIAGEDGKAVKEAIFTPIHTNEAARTKFKNSSRATIKNLNLSKQESEIVQQVGEGKMALTEIPQGVDAKKVENAVNTFKTWYNDVLDQANEVLIRNGYAPVGKIDNYFPHFTGDDPLMKALGIKLDNMELPTDINGITANFKPGKQFFGNFLKRTGDKTTFDAVAGFDRYVEGISNVIYHTDDIKTLRTFIDELRLKYSSDEVIKRVNEIRNSNLPEAEMEERISDILKSGDTHLSNATADLEEYTNVLAGKKDLADRAAERWFGRPIYNAVNAISNRIGRNMTAISPSSWLTNFIPVTQSLATTSKAAVLQAFDDTIRNLVKNDGFIDKSTFLTNRVGSDILDKGIVEKTGDVLSAPFKWIDNFTSNVVTRAKYWEGIDKGMSPEDAMKQADDWAAKILGDRSKGAQPTLFNQRNPITRVLTQFQLEVNNQVSFIMKDMPREYLKGGANPKNVARLSSALGQLAIYSWLYNEMYEKATGRRPAADIIGIALNLKKDLQNSNMGKSQAGVNLAKNVANTLPFSSTFTGGRIPIGTPLAALGKGVTGAYEVATGERDVKTGLAQAGKDLAKGAAYIVPPFGGSQLIKTTEGLSAVNKGGAYKTNAAGEKALQYPIANTIGNKVQAAIFGKSALGETRAFYDNMVKALSTDQTKAYEYAVNKGIQPKVVYDQILTLRKLMPEQGHKGVTDNQRIKSIRLNQNLTEEQKRLMIQLFVNTEQGKKLIEKK